MVHLYYGTSQLALEEGEIFILGDKARVDHSIVKIQLFKLTMVKVGFGYVGISFSLYTDTKPVKLMNYS